MQSDIRNVIIAVEAVGAIELVPFEIELAVEDKVEERPGPPEEAEPQFPGGLDAPEKLARVQFQNAVQDARHGDRRALADADNADFPRTYDANSYFWHGFLENQCGQKTRTTATNN
jgi:hypothetical protein